MHQSLGQSVECIKAWASLWSASKLGPVCGVHQSLGQSVECIKAWASLWSASKLGPVCGVHQSLGSVECMLASLWSASKLCGVHQSLGQSVECIKAWASLWSASKLGPVCGVHASKLGPVCGVHQSLGQSVECIKAWASLWSASKLGPVCGMHQSLGQSVESMQDYIQVLQVCSQASLVPSCRESVPVAFAAFALCCLLCSEALQVLLRYGAIADCTSLINVLVGNFM